jgi:hypothetical protein
MDMKVTLVYGSGVEPFTKDAEFSLDEATHVIVTKIDDRSYSPVSGMSNSKSALKHYVIDTKRHGIGITGSGATLRVVGVAPVDPARTPVQASGMWVAEPQ